MKNKSRLLILITIGALLLPACCASPVGPNLSAPAFQNASPENQDRIRRGNIGLGMNLQEFRAAWPDAPLEFVNSFTAGASRYETWRTMTYSPQARSEVYLWLELKDGIIEDISETRKK